MLADYFDYIAGTSTGAIIAACLALGLKVECVRALYMDHGTRMFRKAPFFKRHLFKCRGVELEHVLKGLFGAETILGTADLETLL